MGLLVAAADVQRRGIDHPCFDRDDEPLGIDLVQVVARADGIAWVIDRGRAGAHNLELACGQVRWRTWTWPYRTSPSVRVPSAYWSVRASVDGMTRLGAGPLHLVGGVPRPGETGRVRRPVGGGAALGACVQERSQPHAARSDAAKGMLSFHAFRLRC